MRRPKDATGIGRARSDARRRHALTALLIAVPIASLCAAAGCARGPAVSVLSERARREVVSTCAGDMVRDVYATAAGSVVVRLNTPIRPAEDASAVAKAEADVVFERVPDAESVEVRDVSGAPIASWSRAQAAPAPETCAR